MDNELKPGQKHPTPTPGFGDRVFYETLLRQRPDSAIAQEWCVHYGVLPYNEAERLNNILQERKRKQRLAGGGASTPPPAKKKKKARVLKEEATDISAPGGDGIGRTTL